MNRREEKSKYNCFHAMYLWTHKLQFAQRIQEAFTKNQNVSTRCPMITKWNSKTKYFPKSLFLWTRKLQFSQPFQNNYKKQPEISCSKWTVHGRKVTKNWSTSYSSFRNVDSTFANPADTFPPNGGSIVPQCRKVTKKGRKTVFLVQCVSVYIGCSFDNSAKK